MLCKQELNLSLAVPDDIAAAALEITNDVLGPDGLLRYDLVDQRSVAVHEARVAAYCLHATGSERVARKGAAHDSGKPNLAGISDDGVWTQERRAWVRQAHSVSGAAWLLDQNERLPDCQELAWVAEHHHLPPDGSPKAQDLIVVEACDRLDALTSRAYVGDREGLLTSHDIVDLVFTADPATDIHSLPYVVEIDGQVIDLRAAVGEIAAAAQQPLAA